MQEQPDFLKKLDEAGPFVSPTAPLSPEQIKLNSLLAEKESLSERMDRCPMCSQGEEYRCNKNHKQEWTLLLAEIEKLEEATA